MRLLLCAAGAALLAGSVTAQPVPRHPQLDRLQTYCVRTGAEPAAAVAAADADGWMPVPDTFMRNAPQGLTGVQARMRTSREGMEMLFAGRGTFPAGGRQMQMDFCMVGAQPGAFDALAAATGAWAGGSPVRRTGDQVMWAWAETPQGRRPLSGGLSSREAEALMEAGGMRVVMTMRRGEMVMVGYAQPRLPGRAL